MANYGPSRICQSIELRKGSERVLVEKKGQTEKSICPFLLPDLDSNQDKQNQNLSYYHYTIGHPALKGMQK